MQARLRAQLGDRSEYSGERRRRSIVVASIVLTITDPLRGSYPFWYYLQAALIRSYGTSFACMELTIISRFQRLQASTKSLLHSLYFFSAFDTLHPRQIANIQYGITIMGGREVSRPYRVRFFAEGERFLSFCRCHRPPQGGRRWCCGVADSSICLKSDMPQHQRQVRSTGIAKRLFFMFFVSVPPVFIHRTI